jgi:hypothetical protein
MNEGETWDAIPQELLVDCAQLTKANSIEGLLLPSSTRHVTLNISRQQEGQYYDHLHTMVESQERWKYGCRSGLFQGQQKGQFYASVL